MSGNPKQQGRSGAVVANRRTGIGIRIGKGRNDGRSLSEKWRKWLRYAETKYNGNLTEEFMREVICLRFVAKVESGKGRSVETYREMKEALGEEGE